MSSITELRLFVCVARQGSLSAAARSMNVTPAAVSFALKRLEERLQTRLFIRSTRDLRLTEDGCIYLQNVSLALQILEDGENALRNQAVLGPEVLKITAPCDLSRNVLIPCLDVLKVRYPNVKIHLLVSDKNFDFYRQPVDLALRFGIPETSDLVALPIWEKNYRVVCASPHYVEKNGAINHPADLSDKNCIAYQVNGKPYDLWTFSKDNEVIDVKTHGDRRCNDGEIVRRWILEGHGIAYKSWLDVSQDIKFGKLFNLLPEWRGGHAPLYLLCPHRLHVTNTVKTLCAILRERCELIS